MKLTFATEDQAYSVDVDPEMELGDIMALLEAESGIPTSSQAVYHANKQLTSATTTLKGYGINDDDMLLLRNTAQSPATGSTSQPSGASGAAATGTMGTANEVDTAAEMARSQILSDHNLMQQLREAAPELAEAALNNPARFKELYNARGDRYRQMQEEKRQMEDLLMADPFDVEAQRKIEEAIRQERVLENMEHAMEFSPESFGRVMMLYVDVEVNGHPVKAFVDSGAQATILSPDMAEQCGIMRLLDTRFAGIARGVGTAKILGRIHSAQIKVGSDLFLPCAFTVMEGKGVDLLFGLDMLKRYQACIDLQKNALVIQGREIRFLSEHELPKNALEEELEVDDNGNVKLPSNLANSSAAQGAAASASAAAVGPNAVSQSSTQKFPGPGQTLSTPSSGSVTASQGQKAQGSGSRWPENSISALTTMGVSREEAIRLLDASDGNVDMAANLMF